MADKGKIACLLGEGFEDSEFRIPYDRLRAGGYSVDIISTEVGKKLSGCRGKEVVEAEVSVEDANVEDYLGLLIPGGYSPDHLRADLRFVDWVTEYDTMGRPMGLVCHGPQLLLTAGLVKGRTLTAWPTVQGDLRLAGANVKDSPVVIDGSWITSRKPDDLEAFSAAFLRELASQREGERPGSAVEALRPGV